MRDETRNHAAEAGLRYEEEARRRTVQPHVPFGRVFGAVVAVEAAFVVAKSLREFLEFHPDYALWPLTLVFLIAWPAVFVGAAYVLWRPRFPGSALGAFLRSLSVWLVGLVNLIVLVALLSMPDMVVRSFW